MSIAVIYKITNKINNRSYVGVTTNFYNRMKSHKSCANYKLKRDIKTHTWENFDKKIILKSTEEYCYSIEDAVINLYKCEYNIATGGEGRRKGDVEGSKNPAAKLKESEVLEIRDLYSTGEFNYKSLAIKYTVSKSSIANIVTGRTWKHIGGPTSTNNIDKSRIKLTVKDAEDIRYAYKDGGITYPQIAEIYQIDRTTVCDIIRGKTW